MFDIWLSYILFGRVHNEQIIMSTSNVREGYIGLFIKFHTLYYFEDDDKKKFHVLNVLKIKEIYHELSVFVPV